MKDREQFAHGVRTVHLIEMPSSLPLGVTISSAFVNGYGQIRSKNSCHIWRTKRQKSWCIAATYLFSIFLS